MSRLFRRARARARDESGLTMIELLVASAMSVLLVGAVGSMLISAMRTQPEISERTQTVSSARWVLERMTREIRNGIRVDTATASTFSFLTYVRRTSCGSGTPSSSATPAIKCKVTYQCTATACTRSEGVDGGSTGTPRPLFSGINDSSVFCYVPSTATDPLSCGTAVSKEKTTYVGIRLQMPSSSGGSLSVTDGVSLRNATLLK